VWLVHVALTTVFTRGSCTGRYCW